jgi:hypothetical protein
MQTLLLVLEVQQTISNSLMTVHFQEFDDERLIL